jgi:hypothetical protein
VAISIAKSCRKNGDFASLHFCFAEFKVGDKSWDLPTKFIYLFQNLQVFFLSVLPEQPKSDINFFKVPRLRSFAFVRTAVQMSLLLCPLETEL